MTFTQAYHRLEEISAMLQWDSIVDITQIIDLQAEAKKCYDICQWILKKSEDAE